MKKRLKTISSFFIGIIAIIYLCTLILNIFITTSVNTDGYIEINNKIVITLKEDIKEYNKESLIILDKINIDDITTEEVFIERNDDIILTNINNITNEDNIIGIKINSFNNIGKIVDIIGSKYLLYILILIPGIAILIYELITLLKKIKINYKDNNIEEVKVNYELIKENEELTKTAHKLFEQKDLFNTGMICKIVEDKSDNANDLVKEIQKLNNKKKKKNSKLYQN